MRSIGIFRVFFCLIAMVLISCASRVPPNGGLKDAEAPILVKIVPDSASTNFQGDKISFTFNEFIELKDGGSGIVISPPLRVPPKVSLKGKTVQLTFTEPLDSATTYSVTIGKSVTDISEGNAFPDRTFAFSTGNTIDSLRVKGNLLDGYTNQPIKDALVMLYSIIQDSMPFKQIPRYFARTDASGNYQLNNIRQGTYLAFALKDGNANYLYDQPEEKIGYRAEALIIDSTITQSINFRLSQEIASNQRLLKKEFELPGKIVLKYALPIESLKITDFSSQAIPFYSEYTKGTDSIIVWIPNQKKDSLSLYVETQQGGKNKTDTLVFAPDQIRRKMSFKKSKMGIDTLLRFTNTLENGKISPENSFEIIPNHPGKLIKPENLFWIIGKDTIQAKLNLSRDSVCFRVPIILPVNPLNKASFYMKPGAFEDVFGMKNDTLKLTVSLLSPDDLGLLDFRVITENPTDDLLLELVDSKGKKLFSRKVKSGEALVFESLIPGKYSIRILSDLDKNGKWTPGKFTNRTQAETMRYYSGEVNIRAGWDLELEWNLDSSMMKK